MTQRLRHAEKALRHAGIPFAHITKSFRYMTKPFLYMTKPCPHITTSLLHITKCPKTVMAWDTRISILDTQPPEDRLPTAKGAKSPSLAAGEFHDP
jgi:hypothetical protein